uniref:signal recognition particle receptor subunit alpha n=1 Tax=Methanobrevibacter smithii TaxID=2173 RepID=UPI0037DD1B03
MFESLKKKFSRTSDKLEEELIEEAQEENNLEEESGKKFSFFSFGGKDKKEENDSESNVAEIPQEVESIQETDTSDDETSDDKDEKSGFWSFGKKSGDNKEEPQEEEESAEEIQEEEEPKKSHFWSRNKEEDTEESEDADEKTEEKKSRFWSRNKDNDFSEENDEDEEPSGMFSFITAKTISEKHLEDILWELEMGLLEGDVAMEVASAVVDSVKDDLVGRKIKRSNDITEYTYNALRNAVAEIIDIPGKSMTEMIEAKKAQGEPLVVMFVGINGTGKTTTIGKLANYYLKKGYTSVIAA